MTFFNKILLLTLLLAPRLRAETAPSEVAATLIEMSGEVFYEAEGGAMKTPELGQFFVEGDRLQTKDASGLQLVLADGSTLTLGPNSELSIAAMGDGGAESKSLFELLKGSVNAIVEKLSAGATFEIKTAHSVAAVKGTQFEVSASEAESAVTVEEGVVAMSDLERRKTTPVGPFQRCTGSATRQSGAFDLSKREAGEFKNRWQRARLIHGQRREILKAFEQHLHERKAFLQARRATLRQKIKEKEKKADGAGKKDIQDRRKAARERFEKAREEIKKGRKHRRDAN